MPHQRFELSSSCLFSTTLTHINVSLDLLYFLWHINLRRLSNLLGKYWWYYLTYTWRDYTFLKDFSLKVNVIARLEIELSYFDLSVQHVNHYTPGMPLTAYKMKN